MIFKFGDRPFIAVEMRGNVNEPDLSLYIVTNPNGDMNDPNQPRLPDEDAMTEVMVQGLEMAIDAWRQEHPRGSD